MNSELAGLGIATRFVIRRNWLRMVIWAAVLALLVVMVVNYQNDLFPDQTSRDAYAKTASTPGVAALTGLPYAAATAGGILNIKLWMTGAITLALVCIFLVTRNGRAEEESGRLELLRAGALGRYTMSLAGWLVTAGFALAAGIASGLAAVAMGLPVAGSLLMGLSWTGVGLAFVGVAAITGQLASTGRGATSWAAIALAAAYVVRAVADVNATADIPAWYTWISPIGWAQQTRSFGEDQWWALIPLIALGVAGCTAALALESRRDLGAGIVALRQGPTTVSALTRTVIGLPLRLQRSAIISWLIGVAFAAVFFGGIATVMESLLADLGASSLGEALTGGADTQLDGLLGFFLLFFAVLVSAFAVQSTLALRHDESNGYTGWEWTAAVSRWTWVLARLVIPAGMSVIMLLMGGWLMGAVYGAQIGDLSQGTRFTLAAVGYAPVVGLLIATVALIAAVVPRAAVAVSWSLLGVIVLFAALGDVLGIPHDIVAATPYWVVPQLGHTDMSWLPVWLMGAASIIVAVAAMWRYRLRDEVSA